MPRSSTSFSLNLIAPTPRPHRNAGIETPERRILVDPQVPPIVPPKMNAHVEETRFDTELAEPAGIHDPSPQSPLALMLRHLSLGIPMESKVKLAEVPISPLSSADYTLGYSVKVQSAAEEPRVTLDLTTGETSIPFPSPLSGTWSVNPTATRFGLTHSTLWQSPLPRLTFGKSVAQLRWTTRWEAGLVGDGQGSGELGIRNSLRLDSRVLVDGSQLTTTSATLQQTTHFRPENALLYAAVVAVSVVVFVGIPAAGAALAAGLAASGAYILALIGRLAPSIGR